MSETTIEEEGPPTQSEALDVMNAVADSDEMRKAHSLIIDFCSEEDLRGIVDLAWRYQFIDDRNPFKKEIREIQANVARKIEREGSEDT